MEKGSEMCAASYIIRGGIEFGNGSDAGRTEKFSRENTETVSYTHLRAHET